MFSLNGYEVEISIRVKFKRAMARPGKVSLHSKRESDMNTFGLTFNLPDPGPDVSKRELTVKDDALPDPIVQMLDPTAKVSQEVVVSQDTTVTVTLVDIDDVGNRSEPSDPFVYKVVDDVPPAKPGELHLGNKREID